MIFNHDCSGAPWPVQREGITSRESMRQGDLHVDASFLWSLHVHLRGFIFQSFVIFRQPRQLGIQLLNLSRLLAVLLAFKPTHIWLQTYTHIHTDTNTGLLATFQVNSALTLLVGRQEGHLTCKNWAVRCWRGYLSAARCKWLAYGPSDATATPSSLARVKSRMVYLSGAGLLRLSWKKGR